MAYPENVSSMLFYVASACVRSISIITVLFHDIASAGSSAQRYSRNTQITIIEKRDYDMFSPCGIPYAIEGKVKDFEELKYTVPLIRGTTKLLQHEALKINLKEKKVLVKNLINNIYCYSN